MKNSCVLAAIVLLTGLTGSSQTLQRYFDNFDTTRGVFVRYVEPPVVTEKRVDTPKSSAKGTVKHYLPSPPVRDDYKRMLANRPIVKEADLVRLTVQSAPAMSIPASYERYLRPPVENARLLMSKGSNLRGQSTGDDMIDAFIVDSSKRYGIDPLLIYAQMSQESSFKRRATSNKGAAGLMQLMPATARRLGVTDIYDPQQNIDGGVKYMRILLNMFAGDLNLALAGYNAGEGAVIKYGYQIPPYNETQDYVRRISARYRSISGATLARNPFPAYK